MVLRGSKLRAGLLLAVAVWSLACLGGGRQPNRRGGGGGGGGGGQGGEEADGRAIRSLSEIYGGDGCGAPSRTGHVVWKVGLGDQGPWNVDLYIPEGAGPRRGVLLLHGAGSNGARFVKHSNYDVLAAQKGAILAAPSSIPPQGTFRELAPKWNTGRDADYEFGRNDVAFLDAITEALRKEACVDKLLGTGFSDGSSMSMAWACRSRRGPDALVSDSGQMHWDAKDCSERAPFPYRFYMGTEDPRYLGEGDQRSAAESAEVFATLSQCGSASQDQKVSKDTTCSERQGCRAPTELCAIRGLAHHWANPPKADVDVAVDGFAFFEQTVP